MGRSHMITERASLVLWLRVQSIIDGLIAGALLLAPWSIGAALGTPDISPMWVAMTGSGSLVLCIVYLRASQTPRKRMGDLGIANLLRLVSLLAFFMHGFTDSNLPILLRSSVFVQAGMLLITLTLMRRMDLPLFGGAHTTRRRSRKNRHATASRGRQSRSRWSADQREIQ
jgi:hypothetical protein